MESELEFEESGNKKTRREGLTSALRPRIRPYLQEGRLPGQCAYFRGGSAPKVD